MNKHTLQKHDPRGPRLRILSWNCNMGLAKKWDAMMSLEPDIAVLQECSVKDIEAAPAPFKHWVGANKHKGLAIIGFANHEYHLDASATEHWPWFLPVRIDDVPLHLLGVWASVKTPQMSYVRVTHQAIDHYHTFLSLHNAILIGDLNSNSIWDRPNRERSHGKLVERLHNLGLVSAYHLLTGEVQGREVTPTQYMYRHLARPYHLDFAFVSKTLSASCDLIIGKPDEWISRSDHMPLLLTVSISSSIT